MCVLLPSLTVWSSLLSLLTCCFLLVRRVHNRELKKVEDGEEQLTLVLLLIHKEEEVMKIEQKLKIFPPVINRKRRTGTDVS